MFGIGEGFVNVMLYWYLEFFLFVYLSLIVVKKLVVFDYIFYFFIDVCYLDVVWIEFKFFVKFINIFGMIVFCCFRVVCIWF